jgi:hypothetical protein
MIRGGGAQTDRRLFSCRADLMFTFRVKNVTPEAFSYAIRQHTVLT